MDRKKIIRLSKSVIGDSEKEAVMGVLDREYLGMGDEVNLFEKNLKDFFHRPVVCVSSGTAALHLAIQACGIGEGDEVLVQSLTYVATIQAISATGARPIMCDVNSETLNIDLHDVKRKLTKRTKAIIPVHYAGNVGDLSELFEFSKQEKLRVIEDAAHAFGSKYNNNKIGSQGDITCFSFDGIKNLTSGEGGCIVSNDLTFINKVKDARLLGVEKDTENRYSAKRTWFFDVNEQGWRYHMSNIMAAIGIEQLKRFNYFKQRRKEIALQYKNLLNNNEGIKLFSFDYQNIVMHIFPILLIKEKKRELVREELLKLGIQTGIHYFPNHLLSFYKGDNVITLKNTEMIFPKLLTLPMHPDLSEEDVSYIVNQLLKVLKT